MFNQYADRLNGSESYFQNDDRQWFDKLSGLPVFDPSGILSGDPMLVEDGMYDTEPEVKMFEEITPDKGIEKLLQKTFGISGFEALLPNYNFNTDHAILGVFNAFGHDLEIDNRWADRLTRYVIGFTTKNEQYVEFFGNPYLGIHRIVFTTEDRNRWFTEIFDVDEEELRENLHACKLINATWKVTGDVFNLSIVYLLYRTFHSDLHDRVKHNAMVNILAMYHYKCLTSIMANDYKYLAKKEIAMETYNRLSMRYDIKRYGSWMALIRARAEFILDPKTGIHYKTFTTMDDDKKIIYMVGDIQDRLRGVINDINKVFHEVKSKTNIVRLDGGMVTLEDGVSVREVTKNVTQYKNYIQNVLSSSAGFYKDELVGYAAEAIDNSPRDKLERIIRVFPDQYNSPKGAKYREFVDEVTTHLFEYLTENGIRANDLREVLRRMRGAYLSSRSQNQSVFKMRDEGDDIVRQLTGIKTRITVSSLRTSLMLYIVLRTLTKDAYK